MKNVLTFKGYQARVDFDPDDGIFVGRIAGIADNVGFHADTVQDLLAAFYEAVDDYLETCAKIGKSPDKSYSGNVYLRVHESTHARASQAAELAGQSLNEFGEIALEAAADRVLNRASLMDVLRDTDEDNRSEDEHRRHHHATSA